MTKLACEKSCNDGPSSDTLPVPQIERGLGFLCAVSELGARDVRLIRRAVADGWKIPTAAMEAVPAVMVEIALGKRDDGRPTHSVLYAAAIGTGLRASELASLTPAHFDLTETPATVSIDAKNEKARRGDTLPLPSDLVGLLSPWIAGTPPNAPLWPGRWAKNKAAGKMLKADLEAARAVWMAESANEADRAERERSDFLKFENADGQTADFHALRHTYLSRLGRSGASPKVMQRLARHSTVELTLGRYTHAGLHDLNSAVEGLPALPVDRGDNERQTLRATGTDGRSTPAVLPSRLPEPVAVQCPSVPLRASREGSGKPVGQTEEPSEISDNVTNSKGSSGERGTLRSVRFQPAPKPAVGAGMC